MLLLSFDIIKSSMFLISKRYSSVLMHYIERIQGAFIRQTSSFAVSGSWKGFSLKFQQQKRNNSGESTLIPIDKFNLPYQ